MAENRPRQVLTLQHFSAHITQALMNPAASDTPASHPQGSMRTLISGEHSGKGIAGLRGQNKQHSPQPSAGLCLLAPQERRYRGAGLHSRIQSAKKQPTTDSLALVGINEAVI